MNPAGPPPPRGAWSEVLAAFLRLGLTSFGGPIAHIGYFREAFVVRRRWIGEAAFAELVALCQFLPGPTSSQVGFAIGLTRAGPLGAAAAWLGFTLPSAVLLTLLAMGTQAVHGALVEGLSHGLAVVAAAVVAQALIGMARTLTPDARRAGIALAALAVVTLAPPGLGQPGAIALGALAGLWLCEGRTPEGPDPLAPHVSRPAGAIAFAIFLALLAAGPAAAALSGRLEVRQFAAFYGAGALVFGGGHVVLPLLHQAVVAPGWVDHARFLAGYGAAQAAPGPLFAFAAYLGAAMGWGPGGAALATVAIFLPGLLILIAALPFWRWVRGKTRALAACQGAGAAVVGVLAFAFHDPIWTKAVTDGADFLAFAAGAVMLMAARWPPLAVVICGALYGLGRAALRF